MMLLIKEQWAFVWKEFFLPKRSAVFNFGFVVYFLNISRVWCEQESLSREVQKEEEREGAEERTSGLWSDWETGFSCLVVLKRALERPENYSFIGFKRIELV